MVLYQAGLWTGARSACQAWAEDSLRSAAHEVPWRPHHLHHRHRSWNTPLPLAATGWAASGWLRVPRDVRAEVVSWSRGVARLAAGVEQPSGDGAAASCCHTSGPPARVLAINEVAIIFCKKCISLSFKIKVTMPSNVDTSLFYLHSLEHLF